MYKTIEGVCVQNRQTWAETEDYLVEWQHLDEHLFVHIQIFEFNKSIYKEIVKHFEDMCEQAKTQGYGFLFSFTRDERMVRLSKGWKVSGEHGGFKILSWELN